MVEGQIAKTCTEWGGLCRLGGCRLVALQRVGGLRRLGGVELKRVGLFQLGVGGCQGEGGLVALHREGRLCCLGWGGLKKLDFSNLE